MGSSPSCMTGANSPAAALNRSVQAGDEHSVLMRLIEKPALLSKPTAAGSKSGGLGGSLAAQLLPWTAAHHNVTPVHVACESKQVKVSRLGLQRASWTARTART